MAVGVVEDLGSQLESMQMLAELATALARLGVVAGHSTLRLSSVEPRRLVEASDSELRVLVYHGSKFISTDWFEPLLRRKRGLHIKFLIHEPIKEGEEDTYKDLYEKFKGRAIHDTDRLEIRTYTSEPDFRMMFIDSNYLVLSHYSSGDDDHVADSDTLWELPHLVIACRGRLSGDSNFSLYQPFQRLWEERWHTAKEYCTRKSQGIFTKPAEGRVRHSE